MWLVIAFAVFYVLSQPQQAGAAVRSAGTGLTQAANQVVVFVSSMFG